MTESAQPCGCDAGANWVCQRHQDEARTVTSYIVCPCCSNDNSTLMERIPACHKKEVKDRIWFECRVCSKEFAVEVVR